MRIVLHNLHNYFNFSLPILSLHCYKNPIETILTLTLRVTKKIVKMQQRLSHTFQYVMTRPTLLLHRNLKDDKLGLHSSNYAKSAPRMYLQRGYLIILEMQETGHYFLRSITQLFVLTQRTSNALYSSSSSTDFLYVMYIGDCRLNIRAHSKSEFTVPLSITQRLYPKK